MSSGGKVIVTGGKGFIGNHVMRTLSKRGYMAVSYDLVDGFDILDSKMLEATVYQHMPVSIVHLAGQVFLKPALQDPQRDAMLNIVGTLNVLQAAQKHACRVIFSSSGAVYGNNYQYPEPISPYGLSKLTAERYCQLYHQLYQIETIVFRFSSVYGLGRRASVNVIVENAVKRQSVSIMGDGCQTRDFTHVEDAAEAICMAVEGCFPSGTYDIGTGVATSINELIQLVEREVGKKLRFTYAPLNKIGDPQRNELNVSTAARYGFKAKISLEEGIKQLIKEVQ